MQPIQNGPAENPTRMFVVAFGPEAVRALPRHVCTPGAIIVLHTLDSLSVANLLGHQAPDYIVSPLVAGAFDAQDIAWMLSRRGYAGRYIAIAPMITAPQVVRDDVARIAPDLKFDVVTLEGPPSLRAV